MVTLEHGLEHYILNEILPKLTAPPFGSIQATSLSKKMPVYLLSDGISGTRVVSKTFKYGSISLDTAWKRAETEYANLKQARDQFGMGEGDFKIVAPLGKNKGLSALLVIEYGKGNTLDHYIKKAIQKQETRKLDLKLRFLARFLVKLHGNSEGQSLASPDIPRKYLNKVLHSLQNNLLTEGETQYIEHLGTLWWSRNGIFSDHEVMVHGDATPTNFIFHHEKVIGIDLEKMKLADRCWDLGFLSAELKHHFLLEKHSSWESEPFIRHLLLEYAAGFHDLDMFKSSTRRLPLYMALGLLRIARNNWLDKSHRYKLVEEAKLCLKYKG